MKEMLIRHLRRLDGIAGLTAGLFVLSLSHWLANLYALPIQLLIFNGIANLLYGTYSCSSRCTWEPAAQLGCRAEYCELPMGRRLLCVSVVAS